jgi:uncharacterized membrane protein (DUF373 family)
MDEMMEQRTNEAPPQDRFGAMGRMLMRLLGNVEDTILYAISAVLIVAMVALLIWASAQFVQSMGGDLRAGTLRLLDSVLLVMMMVEILSTISVSLRLHTLAAEQFLIIGIIAAIRRVLVITAEQTELLHDPDIFRLVLYELALLGLLVLILAGAIYLLHRSRSTQCSGASG